MQFTDLALLFEKQPGLADGEAAAPIREGCSLQLSFFGIRRRLLQDMSNLDHQSNFFAEFASPVDRATASLQEMFVKSSQKLQRPKDWLLGFLLLVSLTRSPVGRKHKGDVLPSVSVN